MFPVIIKHLYLQPVSSMAESSLGRIDENNTIKWGTFENLGLLLLKVKVQFEVKILTKVNFQFPLSPNSNYE